MNYTTNYNLNKPTYADNADILPAVGANMDTIDTLIKALSDNALTADGDINTLEGQMSTVNGQISTINSTSLPAKLTKVGDTIESYTEKKAVNATATGTVQLDLSVQNIFDLTLTGATTIEFINIPASPKVTSVTLIISQGGTPYAVTYPTGVKWSNDVIPDISTASKTSIITMVTSDAGTRWYGVLAGNKFTT